MRKIFIGLNVRALELLQLEGTPAIRQTKIIYPDGSERIVSEHSFIEINYEKEGDYIIWRKGGRAILEEKPQESVGSYLFTALWSLEANNWVSESLWTDEEKLSYE